MKPTLYAMITQTANAAQDNPGIFPKIPGTVTVDERVQQQDHHTVYKNVYKNHINTKAALKILISNAVED